jgi:hypothetical protein
MNIIESHMFLCPSRRFVEDGGIAPLILNLHTWWKWAVSLATRVFRTVVRYTLNRKYAVTRTGLGTVENIQNFSPCQESKNDSLDVQPVAQLQYYTDWATELRRRSHKHSKTVIKYQNQFAGGTNGRWPAVIHSPNFEKHSHTGVRVCKGKVTIPALCMHRNLPPK